MDSWTMAMNSGESMRRGQGGRRATSLSTYRRRWAGDVSETDSAAAVSLKRVQSIFTVLPLSA